MIGKPEWFKPRKLGWGLGLRSKEGALYVAAFVALFAIIDFAPLPEGIKLIGLLGLAGVFVLDTLHIMLRVYSLLDEREQKHQMLAETNASYVAVVGLLIYSLYLTIIAGLDVGSPQVIPLLGILAMMALVKGGTLLLAERDAL